jgi:tetratricopeptide (TPR) repeat protein
MRIIMKNNALFSLLPCLTIAFSLLLAMPLQATNVTTSQSLEEAETAYFYRDYKKVTDILAQLKPSIELNQPQQVEAQLLTIATEIQQDKDDAEDRLENFLEQHADNAKAQYFAGLLWLKIANDASFFSKMSYFKRYVKAITSAAQLAPNNPRYQMEAARAFGQPSMMGGDSTKQKPIVDKLMTGNSMFAHIAMMDYLQNTQNEKASMEIINRVSIEFATNIEILERAAQLLRTLEKDPQARTLFTRACHLPPGKNQAFSKWHNACLLSAVLSLQSNKNLKQGLTAIERLLLFTVVEDEETKFATSIKKSIKKQLSNKVLALH